MRNFVTLLLFVALFALTTARLSQIVTKEMADYTKSAPKSKKIDVMLLLRQQVDFKALQLSKYTHHEKGQVVLDALIAQSKDSQKNLVSLLESLRMTYTTYYVQNCIFVDALTPEQITMLNEHPDVDEILSNRIFKVPLESLPMKFENPEIAQVEWNIIWTKSDQVWKKNITGRGYTVAVADTGLSWDHPALKPNYRGVKGEVVNHEYHWWDGIRKRVNPRGSRCPVAGKVPCDDHGHGTHCAGTAAGSSSYSRKVGVAGEASIISCRNMEGGDGRPQTYIECLEFFLAPFDWERKNPKPELRPVSIGNSYGCPRSEQCEHGSLKVASDALRAAGVFMSVSAGNAGSCSSIRDPPSFYESVISIGASGTRTHSIAGYSSKGPVTVDGSNRMKPDLTAPGSNVVSSMPGGRFGSMSGTSMASPHVNGAVALICHANKKYCYDVEATQKLLQRTAIPQNTTSCSSNGSSPNNVYGHGSVDFLAAVEQALKEL